MTDAKRLARDVLVLRALGERVSEADTVTRQAHLAGSDPGDRTTAKLADGTVIGRVTVAHGKLTAKVTNTAELLAHVRKTAPTEVERVEVERVRASYVKKLLASAKNDGEVIPGVEVVEGDPYVTTDLADGAVQAIAIAWAEGTLPLPTAVLGELEAGQ